MKQELEDQLIEKYPALFAGVDEPLTQNLMGFGCEHGDGWYDLLNTMCRLISWELRNAGWVDLLPEYREEGKICGQYTAPTLKFMQIKEKFGTLRVYYTLNQPEDPEHHKYDQKSLDNRYEYIRGRISGFVTYTEHLSAQVCEVCGKPGKTYYGGWISTKCPDHASAEQLASDGEELP
jgi:hypothetical protein